MPRSVDGALATILLIFVVLSFGLWGLVAETIRMRKEGRKLYAERQAARGQGGNRA